MILWFNNKNLIKLSSMKNFFCFILLKCEIYKTNNSFILHWHPILWWAWITSHCVIQLMAFLFVLKMYLKSLWMWFTVNVAVFNIHKKSISAICQYFQRTPCVLTNVHTWKFNIQIWKVDYANLFLIALRFKTNIWWFINISSFIIKPFQP